jgi:drug/metabolite transporter (DMT)-like permease
MKISASSKIYLLFLTVILLWGINWPMNKIAMVYMPAIWHAALRLAIGSASIFVIVALVGKFKIPTRKDLPIVFFMGILQMGMFTMFINLGLNYVDAGRSAILVYTIPLWVTPLAMIFFKEQLNWLKALGLAFGMLGIIILLCPWSIDWSTSDLLYGHAALIGAALCMAVSICAARNLSWDSSPLELLPWQLFIGTLPVLLIACLTSPWPEIEWNQISISAMAYTAILATAIGNGGITMVSRSLQSITVSLGLLGVPLTGVISAVLILEETVTLSMKLAIIFIFGGLICVALSSKLTKEKTANAQE